VTASQHCDTTFPDQVRLPLQLDAEALAGDVDAIPADAWTLHFNTQQYEGEWSGVALRAAVGSPLDLYPDPTSTEHADTELLQRCPNIQAALDQFACPLLTVRLLRLGARARILEHRDHKLGYDDGEIRLHIPITSGPGVKFFNSASLVPMRPGECWYINLSQPHQVVNTGAFARVHLVVDCTVDPWLTEQLAAGT
jgi:hypothetical protein